MFGQIDEVRGVRIVTLRAARAMTQDELAKAAGLSRNTVARAEAGKPLAPDTVKGLCAAFGTTAGELAAGGSGNDEPLAPSAATSPTETVAVLHSEAVLVDVEPASPVESAPSDRWPPMRKWGWALLGISGVLCLIPVGQGSLDHLVAFWVTYWIGASCCVMGCICLSDFRAVESAGKDAGWIGKARAHAWSILLLALAVSMEVLAWPVRPDERIGEFATWSALAMAVAGTAVLGFATKAVRGNVARGRMNRGDWVGAAVTVAVATAIAVYPMPRLIFNATETTLLHVSVYQAYGKDHELMRLRALMEPQWDPSYDRYLLTKMLADVGHFTSPDFDSPGHLKEVERKRATCRDEWLNSPVYDRERCERQVTQLPGRVAN